MVSGKGGRFNIAPLLVNIGSGVGLLAIVSDLTGIAAKLVLRFHVF